MMNHINAVCSTADRLPDVMKHVGKDKVSKHCSNNYLCRDDVSRADYGQSNRLSNYLASIDQFNQIENNLLYNKSN